jgi:hypothetical protein
MIPSRQANTDQRNYERELERQSRQMSPTARNANTRAAVAGEQSLQASIDGILAEEKALRHGLRRVLAKRKSLPLLNRSADGQLRGGINLFLSMNKTFRLMEEYVRLHRDHATIATEEQEQQLEVDLTLTDSNIRLLRESVWKDQVVSEQRRRAKSLR